MGDKNYTNINHLSEDLHEITYHSRRLSNSIFVVVVIILTFILGLGALYIGQKTINSHRIFPTPSIAPSIISPTSSAIQPTKQPTNLYPGERCLKHEDCSTLGLTCEDGLCPTSRCENSACVIIWERVSRTTAECQDDENCSQNEVDCNVSTLDGCDAISFCINNACVSSQLTEYGETICSTNADCQGQLGCTDGPVGEARCLFETCFQGKCSTFSYNE